MVALVLVGVRPGEAPELGGELAALADVAVDGGRVAGAGVRPGQRLAAGGGELDQARRDQLGGRDDLHVAELPDVVVLAVQRAPADEDVGGALHQPLAVDHPLAVIDLHARASMALVHGPPGLLDLKEQRVGAGAALEQHQVDLHPHTAHPDHLPHHVHHREPVEQAPPVLLEGQPVLRQQVIGQVILLVVADRDADRRVGGDPRAPVTHRGQLGEGAAAGAAPALLLDVDGDLAPVGRLEVADQAVDVHAVVPDVQLGHRPVTADAAAVSPHACRDRGVGALRRDPVLPRRHHQAGGEALDVPLERAGQGLVEVAHVEREVPLR